jgi:hypothetical protein
MLGWMDAAGYQVSASSRILSNVRTQLDPTYVSDSIRRTHLKVRRNHE